MTMKVKELIERLSGVNPDIDVLVWDSSTLEARDIVVSHYYGDSSGMPEVITLLPKYRES